jgi:hypothetical protein
MVQSFVESVKDRLSLLGHVLLFAELILQFCVTNKIEVDSKNAVWVALQRAN